MVESKPLVILLRGDHTLSETKLASTVGTEIFRPATPEDAGAIGAIYDQAIATGVATFAAGPRFCLTIRWSIPFDRIQNPAGRVAATCSTISESADVNTTFTFVIPPSPIITPTKYGSSATNRCPIATGRVT